MEVERVTRVKGFTASNPPPRTHRINRMSGRALAKPPSAFFAQGSKRSFIEEPLRPWFIEVAIIKQLEILPHSRATKSWLHHFVPLHHHIPERMCLQGLILRYSLLLSLRVKAFRSLWGIVESSGFHLGVFRCNDYFRPSWNVKAVISLVFSRIW